MDQIPGHVDVIFKQNVTLYRQQSGFISCGLSYIDSVNLANNLQHLFNVSCGTCALLQKSYIAIFPDTANIAALVSAYLADTNVQWASARYYPALNFTPNDSFFAKPSPSATFSSYQWPLDSTHLQAEKAWDITKGDTGTVIAILDLWHAWRHPDLEPTMWINSPEDRNGNGKFDPEAYPTGDLDSVDNDNDGYIDNVSGYHFKFYLGPPTLPYIRCNANPEPILLNKPDTVAWAIAGDPVLKHGAWTWSNAAAKTDNSRGVAGAGFNSHVMPVGFNPHIPPAVPLCYLLQMKLQHGVPDVVNMSLGWWPAHNDSIMLDSLQKLGVVLVAAAGNDDADYANYPARHPKVMSVAATDSNDYRADFSTVNSSVDLSAPGFNYMAHHYFSADSNKAYGYRYAAVDSSLTGNPLIRGTSFSSPQVVGVASLLQSLFPTWSPAQVVAKLRSSTDSIKCCRPNSDPAEESTWIAQGKLGTGRLNAFKAVTFFGNIPGEAVNDTTLSGTVYVSGDIRVHAGKTLRIAAGTVLKFYPGDVMKGGADIAKEEIVVDSGGTLIVQGTAGSPVQFISFNTAPGSQDWRGVVVKKGGSARFFHTQF
ncbi:MAG: S8 family serine peptidase, partial [Nitrososphaera sp.]|nr:S8 family serine peptidase [Nitrososphaera sp.]